MKNSLIIATVLLSWQLLSPVAFATTEVNGSSIPAAQSVRSSNSVVKGNLTGKLREERWYYDNQYDSDGNTVSYEETVHVFAFNVDETLSGEQQLGEIEIYLTEQSLDNYEANRDQNALFNGDMVVVGISPDSGASKRGGEGFNISHGQHFSANTEQEEKNVRQWISETLEQKPERIDAQLEQAYGDLGTGDDLNLEPPQQIDDDPLGLAPVQNTPFSVGQNTPGPKNISVGQKGLVTPPKLGKQDRFAPLKSASFVRESPSGQRVYSSFIDRWPFYLTLFACGLITVIFIHRINRL